MQIHTLPSTAQTLVELSCKPVSGAPLDVPGAAHLLGLLSGWALKEDALHKEWRFANFHETMAFANAVAWVAHQQDHHPDIRLGYSSCELRWSTHSVGGLSINDFICAARVDALMGS